MWPCGQCRCNEDGSGGDRWHIPGIIDKTDQCARRMVTPLSDYLLKLHHHYQNGNLAVAGGVTDQPGLYLDAMQVIGSWKKHGASS